MVTQPETSTFPDVYEYETLDPVQGGPGGIANLPLVQLTARTRYLLDQVNALTKLVAAKAANDSPVLTGTPTAPTTLAEASGTQLVTAAWALRRVGGAIAVTISGNYALTAVQAGYGTLVIQGALASEVTLVFPGTQGSWRVLNYTTGGFKVRCRGADPASHYVSVVPGRTKTVWTDGIGFFDASDDLDSATLSGAPVCSTPDQTDNSTRIINSGWAKTFVAGAVALEAAARVAAALNGFGNDFRNPGYQDLPSGCTFRFGTSATTGTGKLCAVLFTAPFPTAALSVVVCEQSAAGWGDPPSPTIFGTMSLDVNGFLVSGARVISGGIPTYQPGLAYSYLAIGH